MERSTPAKRKLPEINVEDRVNREIAVQELEQICSDSMQLKRLIEESNENNEDSQAIKDIKSKALDSILKHMLKLMDVCNAQGFVYGIIAENGKPISGASESLRLWWYEKVNFAGNAPIAIVRHKVNGGFDAHNEELNLLHEGGSNLRRLHELPDSILSSLLSALMKSCDPPQSKYPFDMGFPPPWWPKGDEEWWPQLGRLRKNPGPPPYRRPHDLKKTWKVVAVSAIMKHISPDFQKIRSAVQKSKGLQEWMTSTESSILMAIINQEELLAQKHMDLMKFGYGSSGSGSAMFHVRNDFGVGTSNMEQHNQPQQANLVQVEENVPRNSMVLRPTAITKQLSDCNGDKLKEHDQPHNANLAQVDANVPRNSMIFRPMAIRKTMQQGGCIYTCENPTCPYHNHHLGFHDKATKDDHQLNCPYKSKSFQMPGSSKPQPDHVVMETEVGGAESDMIPDIRSNKNTGNPHNNIMGLPHVNLNQQKKNQQLHLESEKHNQPHIADVVQVEANVPRNSMVLRAIMAIKRTMQLGDCNGDSLEEHNQPHSANLAQLLEANIPRNNMVFRPMAIRKTMQKGGCIYTCENPPCPYHNHHLGFHDKATKDDHQLNCPHSSKSMQMSGSSKPQPDHVLMETEVGGAESDMVPDIRSNKNTDNPHNNTMGLPHVNLNQQQKNQQHHLEREKHNQPHIADAVQVEANVPRNSMVLKAIMAIKRTMQVGDCNGDNLEEHNQTHNANLNQVEASVPRNSMVFRPVAKRKTMQQGGCIYTCENPPCLYHNYHLGFHDKATKDDHQLNCSHRSKSMQMSGSSKPQPDHALMENEVGGAEPDMRSSNITGNAQNNSMAFSNMFPLDLNQ